MYKLFGTVLVATLLILSMASMANAGWTETWESYVSGATPYDGWSLINGTWMGLGLPNHTPGGDQSYKITAGATSRITKGLGFAATDQTSITLEAWFYDSNGASSSKRTWVGLQNDGVVDNALARIGCNNLPAGYTFHYYNGALQMVNTGLGNETGWHYTKLVFTKQTAPNWKIDWQINSVAGTPYTGSVTYAWSASTVNAVALGYNYSTTVEVDWDDIALSNQPVPEPSSLLALGTGLFGMVGFLKRRRS